MKGQFDKIDRQWEVIEDNYRNGTISEDEAGKQNAELEDKLVSLFYNTYISNKDNALGPWAFSNYLVYKQFSATQLDSILKTTPGNYRGYMRVINAMSNAKALDNTAVGKKFVDFAMKSPDGKVQHLSDFVGKDDNFTIVDFWASWCGPCRAEIKGTLTQIYEKYYGNGVKILGVAVWDKPEDTLAAIEQMKIPWHVIIDNHYTTVPTDLYGIAGIPHIMILDQDGIIISRGLQGEPLMQYVDQLIEAKR